VSKKYFNYGTLEGFESNGKQSPLRVVSGCNCKLSSSTKIYDYAK